MGGWVRSYSLSLACIRVAETQADSHRVQPRVRLPSIQPPTHPPYSRRTDLGRGQAFLGELADVLLHVLGGGLGPGGRGALVRDGRGGHALAGAVHATHLFGVGWVGG